MVKSNFIFSLFSNNDNDKNDSNKKNSDLKKRMDNIGLFEDERREVFENGYEPEDFEDDEIEEDDYYSDEE